MVYLSNKISYKNHIEVWTLFVLPKLINGGVLIRAGGLNKGRGVDEIFEN